MVNFVLKIVTPNRKTREISIQKTTVLFAEAGAQYSLVDANSKQEISELTLSKKGETLVLSHQKAPIVYLNHFYQAGSEASFVRSDQIVVSAKNQVIVDSGETSNDRVSGTSNVPSILSDDSGANLAVAEEGHKPDFSFQKLGIDNKTGMWLLGGVGLIGAGLALAASNDDGNDDSTDVVGRTLTGSVALGRLLEGNDLTLTVYGVDRSQVLGSAQLGADGRYSIDLGTYTGVVIVEVRSNGTAADYVDERTGQNADLAGVVMQGVGVAVANQHAVIQVNPLTTVAYLKSVNSGGMTTAIVEQNNQAIASLFGLAHLHNTEALLTNNTANSFDASNGLSQAEWYGAVLAGMSGMDKTAGTQATINLLNAGISIQDSFASFTSSAKVAWQNAIKDYNTDTSGKSFVLLHAKASASIAENMPTQTLVYTAEATGKGTVSFSLSGKDSDAFNINAATGQLTLKAPADFEKQSSYSLNVIAKDSVNNTVVQALNVSVTDQSDPNTSIVVFDLIEGTSSAHSGRAFSAEKSYTIYLRVSSEQSSVSSDGVGPGANDSWGVWTGVNNLGSDDKIILVGSNANVKGKNNQVVNAVNLNTVANVLQWKSANGVAVSLGENGSLHRLLGTVDNRQTLWHGNWISLDKAFAFNNVYLTQMPAGILGSQGLA